MKTNVFEMTTDEREMALEMLLEKEYRNCVRFFRGCWLTGSRTYLGVPVVPCYQIHGLRFQGYYEKDRMLIKLDNFLMGTSKDWLEVLDNIAKTVENSKL